MAYIAKREMKVAVVSIGYADGVPPQLSNKGFALIKGKRARVIGKICMDQLFLDVTDIEDISLGEEVVFIGKSDMERISAEEMAKCAGTISNEILSRLGKRLERIPV